jgi:periplasmic protein TonB
MSNAFLHSLQIGTLATWLSVSGFGMVGLVLPQRMIVEIGNEDDLETVLLPEDFTLGDEALPQGENLDPETPPTAEPLPAPPEIPALAQIEPLPVIPEFAPKVENPPEASPRAKPAPSPVAKAPVGSRTPGATTGETQTATRKGTGTPGTSGNGGSNMSVAARLAAGRMPSPTYPPYSRRNGQTGTVIVEFTVDNNGKVISANIKSPSKWPLLNAEALSTVRSWRFPPGGVMKLQRPIVFQIR